MKSIQLEWFMPIWKIIKKWCIFQSFIWNGMSRFFCFLLYAYLMAKISLQPSINITHSKKSSSSLMYRLCIFWKKVAQLHNSLLLMKSKAESRELKRYDAAHITWTCLHTANQCMATLFCRFVCNVVSVVYLYRETLNVHWKLVRKLRIRIDKIMSKKDLILPFL